MSVLCSEFVFFETGAYIVIVVISPYQRNTIQTLLFKLINW